MYKTFHPPADTDRVAAYGAVGEIPGAMFKQFMTTFQAPDAPNPHDVAGAIVKLLAQPKGSRPARTVVGQPFGADTVNGQTAPVQAHVVEASMATQSRTTPPGRRSFPSTLQNF